MKPCDHFKITKRAIELLPSHRLGNCSRLDRLILCLSSVIEDFWPPQVRLTDWHFYDPETDLLQRCEKRILGCRLTIRPTSKVIYERRVRELERKIRKGGSKRVFASIGRVLHHVQDMSTPAHVTPVYHDLRIPDSYESYSSKHIEERLSRVSIPPERLSELEDGVPKLSDLREKAAEATLDHLNGEETGFPCCIDGEATKARWDLYWRPYSEAKGGEGVLAQKGFGSYGALGKRFGETCAQEEGRTYRVEAEVFRDLHGHLVKKAVKDSLQVLMWAERQMPEKATRQ
jgi:hypothetical protein